MITMTRFSKSIFYRGEISSSNPALVSTNVESIITAIRTDSKLKEQVGLLRRVLKVDYEAYRRQKTRLPFFIGAQFEEGVRRMDRLISVSSFVLDIDHCFQGLPFDRDLVGELKSDRRIYFMFRSPSGSGLKIVFLLSRPIEQPKQFTDFYRTFVYKFSKQYQLQEYADTVTSDVTRVCFLSHDPDMHYNPLAIPVDVEEYTARTEEEETDQTEVSELKADTEKPLRNESSGPDKEQYRAILQKLGSRKAVQCRRNVKVPHQLDALMPELQDQITHHGFVIEEVLNIQYGKKVKVVHESLWAEVNIFYGKKGFSVVLSPKRGSDPDLGEVVERLAHEAISEYYLSQKLTSIELESNSPFEI